MWLFCVCSSKCRNRDVFGCFESSLVDWMKEKTCWSKLVKGNACLILIRLCRNIIHLFLIWCTSKVHNAKLPCKCIFLVLAQLNQHYFYHHSKVIRLIKLLTKVSILNSAFFRKCKHLIRLWNQISFITEMYVVVFLWFQVSLQCLESFLCTFHCVRQLSDPRAKDALKFW